MGVLERWSLIAVRGCRLVSPAGKSYKAALSPSFSPLVDTNVLLDSLDDMSICDEVHPLRQMAAVHELCPGLRGLLELHTGLRCTAVYAVAPRSILVGMHAPERVWRGL